MGVEVLEIIREPTCLTSSHDEVEGEPGILERGVLLRGGSMPLHCLKLAQCVRDEIGVHQVIRRTEGRAALSTCDEHHGRQDDGSRTRGNGHESDASDDDDRSDEELLAVPLEPLDRLVHGRKYQGT